MTIVPAVGTLSSKNLNNRQVVARTRLTPLFQITRVCCTDTRPAGNPCRRLTASRLNGTPDLTGQDRMAFSCVPVSCFVSCFDQIRQVRDHVLNLLDLAVGQGSDLHPGGQIAGYGSAQHVRFGLVRRILLDGLRPLVDIAGGRAQRPELKRVGGIILRSSVFAQLEGKAEKGDITDKKSVMSPFPLPGAPSTSGSASSGGFSLTAWLPWSIVLQRAFGWNR